MDTAIFDTVSRTVGTTLPRRAALRGLFAGAVATATGNTVFQADDASAKRRKRKKKAKKEHTTPAPVAPPPPPVAEPERNPCEEKNWCVDRSQTCGATGGHGKCLVESGGGNICAEILFQVPSCAECEAPSCTNCRCVLAAGGGDRCNNGANGYDFICVRAV